MQKRYVLALGVVASVALFWAQQGPACPYQRAAAAESQAVIASVDEGTAGGSLLRAFSQSDYFAP